MPKSRVLVEEMQPTRQHSSPRAVRRQSVRHWTFLGALFGFVVFAAVVAAPVVLWVFGLSKLTSRPQFPVPMMFGFGGFFAFVGGIATLLDSRKRWHSTRIGTLATVIAGLAMLAVAGEVWYTAVAAH